MSIDVDELVAECQRAVLESAPHAAVQEVVARAISNPGTLLRALGEPRRAEMQKLHQAGNLTVLNVVWAPWMTLLPHNHLMWAVIGIYTGREDNIFWRRLPGGDGGKVEAAGAKALGERDTVQLGQDIIHSVTNPIPRLTGALHVYGGDFFSVPRSEWDPETLREQPGDGERMRRRFEEANERAVRA